jgi:ribonuclease VapC
VIVVDTSALLAIVLNEPVSDSCIAAMETQDRIMMSAGTLAETLIVASHRGIAQVVSNLIEDLGVDVVPVSSDSARRVAEAHRRWGKGVHPAGLNLGDCFAYELARHRGCPLLYVGDDFTKTDVESAL